MKFEDFFWKVFSMFLRRLPYTLNKIEDISRFFSPKIDETLSPRIYKMEFFLKNGEMTIFGNWKSELEGKN